MGFILKADQPLFRVRVGSVSRCDLYRYHDGAGIDLVRLLHIRKHAVVAQFLHCDQSQIHQADKLVISALIQLLSGIQIAHIAGFQRGTVVTVRKGNVLQLSRKRRMTAVIGPVGIQHADLGHGRIPVFLSLEIVLDMQKILKGHCQAQGIVQFLQCLLIHRAEAVKDLDISRLVIFRNQCRRFFQTGLAGIYRIDAVCFDPCKIVIRDITGDHIGHGRLDDRRFVFL